ncbi:MAG TPA: L-threonylcarbamoyladenylate synthase [Thermoplasmata archaeon]|nr:L-threonylcarbamoyladenylate synthase [Thermoplasmata archaeon]
MGPTIGRAVEALRAGRLVVYPTDTLPGVAARATDGRAVAGLERLKDRPADLPISVAVRAYSDLEAMTDLRPSGRRFVRTHLPGPYTIVARPSKLARRTLASPVFSPDGTLGVRIPDHPVARELARQVGPITATSANRHGRPPCRTVGEARRVFGSAVAAYLTGDPRGSGVPSWLVDLTGSEPRPIQRR